MNDFIRTQTLAEMSSSRQQKIWDQTPSFLEARDLNRDYIEKLADPSFTKTVVSSSDTPSELTVDVIPNRNVAFYRQTLRGIQEGTITAYDLCGNGSSVGTATYEDWLWSPGFGVGEQCPPPTSMPDACCLDSPCVGNGN